VIFGRQQHRHRTWLDLLADHHACCVFRQSRMAVLRWDGQAVSQQPGLLAAEEPPQLTKHHISGEGNASRDLLTICWQRGALPGPWGALCLMELRGTVP
jgi:hypothetical protein